MPADTDIGSSPLALIAKSYLILVYYSTFIAGSLLNFLLLYLIIRYKKLHTLSFVISLQIVFLDLLQLYGVYLFRLVTVFTGKWVFGTGFCVVTGFIFIFVRVARSFLMCVFVIDRFLSVFRSLFLPKARQEDSNHTLCGSLDSGASLSVACLSRTSGLLRFCIRQISVWIPWSVQPILLGLWTSLCYRGICSHHPSPSCPLYIAVPESEEDQKS